MLSTSIERLEQIEAERQETFYSEAFQQWTSSLNVSRLYTNPEPLINATQMNKEYSFSRENKVGILSKIFYL
jgi:hypothetical protein